MNRFMKAGPLAAREFLEAKYAKGGLLDNVGKSLNTFPFKQATEAAKSTQTAEDSLRQGIARASPLQSLSDEDITAAKNAVANVAKQPLSRRDFLKRSAAQAVTSSLPEASGLGVVKQVVKTLASEPKIYGPDDELLRRLGIDPTRAYREGAEKPQGALQKIKEDGSGNDLVDKRILQYYAEDAIDDWKSSTKRDSLAKFLERYEDYGIDLDELDDFIKRAENISEDEYQKILESTDFGNLRMRYYHAINDEIENAMNNFTRSKSR